MDLFDFHFLILLGYVFILVFYVDTLVLLLMLYFQMITSCFLIMFDLFHFGLISHLRIGLLVGVRFMRGGEDRNLVSIGVVSIFLLILLGFIRSMGCLLVLIRRLVWIQLIFIVHFVVSEKLVYSTLTLSLSEIRQVFYHYLLLLEHFQLSSHFSTIIFYL